MEERATGSERTCPVRTVEDGALRKSVAMLAWVFGEPSAGRFVGPTIVSVECTPNPGDGALDLAVHRRDGRALRFRGASGSLFSELQKKVIPRSAAETFRIMPQRFFSAIRRP